MRGLEFVGLELLAVFPIHDPLAGGFQMLACRNRSCAAHDRHQILAALDLHLEDGKAVLRVVVGDTFDEAGEGFGQILSASAKTGGATSADCSRRQFGSNCPEFQCRFIRPHITTATK